MWPNARLPLRMTIGLALAIVLDTVIQLSWKTAASGMQDAETAWGMVETAVGQPMFLFVVALLLCQLVNWLRVLGDADLSFAQPITSLSRITVCMASVIFLNEHIALAQLGGIFIVCAGVCFITRTANEAHANEEHQAPVILIQAEQ